MQPQPHRAGTRPPRNLPARPGFAGLGVPVTVAALALAQLACGAGSAGSTSQSSAPPVDGTVTVDARLFGFELSTDTAHSGPVTFVVSNDEFLPHDFRLTGNGVEAQTDRLEQGDSATLTLNLEPGTYTYMCTVEGHSENMRGTFTVR